MIMNRTRRVVVHTVLRGTDAIAQCVFYPARRGARDSLCGKAGAGPALEPDEPASIEVEWAMTGSEEIPLSEEERSQIIEEAWDMLAED
jgi:hypothetical protein